MGASARYALLSSVQEAVWGSATMRFRFEPQPPEERLVANVRCACFLDGLALVIQTRQFGLSAFPGGTLELGETWREALHRELDEEAGVRPKALRIVGRMHFWSSSASPYRAHLPHPEFQQVVAHADMARVGVPTNPSDGEHVVAVEALPVEDAIRKLGSANPFEAELLRYVRDVRAGR